MNRDCDGPRSAGNRGSHPSGRRGGQCNLDFDPTSSRAQPWNYSKINMNKRILTAVFAALISLPLVVNAADEKKKGGGFAAMDTDKDGKVSKKEFVAAQKDAAKAESRFAQLDTNKDGSLSQEEFAAGQKKKKN